MESVEGQNQLKDASESLSRSEVHYCWGDDKLQRPITFDESVPSGYKLAAYNFCSPSTDHFEYQPFQDSANEFAEKGFDLDPVAKFQSPPESTRFPRSYQLDARFGSGPSDASGAAGSSFEIPA